MNEHKIGYLSILSEKNDTFIGGALIVDESALPIEFRYSQPIKPNKIQSILYGKAITKFIKVETVGKSLVKEMENTPEIYIIPDDEYFILNRYFKIPFIYASYFQREPLPKQGDVIEINESEILIQTSIVREPLKVKVSPQYATSISSLKTLILNLGKNMDIVEPLKRVENALKTLLNENIQI